jgi:serine/threonine-protein kinase RsbT
LSTVLARHELPAAREDDIIVVRRRVREIAEQKKFDTFAIAAVTTATSELARNIIVHAGKGVAIIEEISDGVRVGIRVVFRDEGPGIADVQRVLAGGFSTARTMGLGLSGSRRLVDEFEITSAVGTGTCITIVKWKRF